MIFKLYFRASIALILILSGVLPLYSLEKVLLPRMDQSEIEAYLSAPVDRSSFPLILLMQGSDSESVMGSHCALAERFNQSGIGLLSVEKRGMSLEGKDGHQFREYDFLGYRLQDFSLVLHNLKQGLIPNWNGKLIVLAGSEGGKIAPLLTLHYPEVISGLILVGAGGGWAFSEEMKFQIETALNSSNPIYKFCSKIRDIILPRKIDDKYSKIIEEPNSLEVWYDKTYRWWASFLNYDPLPDLLKLELPIYMIHGAIDPKIPVESADTVKAAFDEADKHNLTYVRYADLEHSIKGRDDVYLPMMFWINNVFESIVVK